MKKLKFYTEAAYVIGLILLALGTAMTAYGDFGISMVVAPAYILHLYLSPIIPFFSFGVAEYTLQAAVLLITAIILRKVKLAYLLSFCATVLYGIVLDGATALISYMPQSLILQIIMYILGVMVCSTAIALLFNSYLPPEAYELFVKEISFKLKKPLHKIKTVYDIGSLALSLVMSLVFFGTLKGIGVGTVVCAFIYGFLIRLFQALYAKLFTLEDKFKWRSFFEKTEN
jgi:uncharacterized membrane protein YczE